jgi:hypothetical protein
MEKKNIITTVYVSLGLGLITYFYFKYGIMNEVLKSPISFINSFFFTMSLTLLYLNDFQLSNIRFIRYIQIISFICIPMYVIYNLYYVTNIFDIIYNIKDDNNVNLYGHVTIDKEAGKAISQGLNTIGSNIGLGATVAGLGSAVAKGVAKSTMPPIQKAGVIIGAGMIGGLFHSKISTINRNNVMQENLNTNINTNDFANNINSHINKLIDNNMPSSPLQDLL